MLSRPVNALFVLATVAGMACGSSTSRSAADGSDGPSGDVRPSLDGAVDANPVCAPAGDGSGDGSTFVDTACGCPSGSVCAGETGGVAGGGGVHCVPIPSQCHGTPSCACMAACACTSGIGLQPERCTDQFGMIECDNLIR
jgi:hypothetical protein